MFDSGGLVSGVSGEKVEFWYLGLGVRNEVSKDHDGPEPTQRRV